MMKPIQPLRLGQRVGGAVALLLLLLALGNILSARQNRQLDAEISELVAVTLPSGRLVHELTGLVEELRGMAALHLVLGGGPELAALESRLKGKRQSIELRLAAHEVRIQDDGDRQHCQAVKASLAEFWREQDKLLALSRLAPADAAAAATARAQLVGASQQTFQKLEADLEAWWTYHEQRAGQAAQQARVAAARAATMQAMLAGAGGLLAGVCVVLLRRWLRRPLPRQLVAATLAPADPQEPASGPLQATIAALQSDSQRIAEITAHIDGIALQAQLLALNAGVVAARSGEPDAGLALAADEARGLARQAGQLARDFQALVNGTVARMAAGNHDPRLAGRSMGQGTAPEQASAAPIGATTPTDHKS